MLVGFSAVPLTVVVVVVVAAVLVAVVVVPEALDTAEDAGVSEKTADETVVAAVVLGSIPNPKVFDVVVAAAVAGAAVVVALDAVVTPPENDHPVAVGRVLLVVVDMAACTGWPKETAPPVELTAAAELPAFPKDKGAADAAGNEVAVAALLIETGFVRPKENELPVAEAVVEAD